MRVERDKHKIRGKDKYNRTMQAERNCKEPNMFPFESSTSPSSTSLRQIDSNPKRVWDSPQHPPPPHFTAPSVDGRTPSICPSITSTQTQIPPFHLATANIIHLTPAVSRSTPDTDAGDRPSITTSDYHGVNGATCITVGRMTIK